MRTRIVTKLVSLFLVAAVLWSAAPAFAQKKLEVNVRCGISSGGGVIGQGKLDDDHKVEVDLVGPNGAKVTATGEIGASGTARALCESLVSSMVAQGVKASYKDKNPSETNAILKANDQEVTLPDGWKVAEKKNKKDPDPIRV